MARLLLDECVDRRLKRSITGHAVSTVHELRALGRTDSAILSLAERDFDILVTVDRNLAHQHDISSRSIAVIVLAPGRTTLAHLLPLVAVLIEAADRVGPGEVVVIESPA